MPTLDPNLNSNSGNWWTDFWKDFGNWFKNGNPNKSGDSLFDGLKGFKDWVDGTSAAKYQYENALSLQKDQQAYNSANQGLRPAARRSAAPR